MNSIQILEMLYFAPQNKADRKILHRIRMMLYTNIFSYMQNTSLYVEGSKKYISAKRNNDRLELIKQFKSNIHFKETEIEYRPSYHRIIIKKIEFTLDVLFKQYDYDTQEQYEYMEEVDYVYFLHNDMLFTGRDLLKELELENNIIERDKALVSTIDGLSNEVNQFYFAEKVEIKKDMLVHILGNFTTGILGFDRVAIVDEVVYNDYQVKKIIKEYESFTEFKAVENDEFITFSKRNNRIEKNRGGACSSISFLEVKKLMENNIE